jgi:hypothetical protein
MKTIDLGNGAECKIYASGNKYWFLNGERHRTDGPAIELTNGFKEWYINDKLHRVDGPAIEYTNGDKEWYLNNEEYSEEDFDMIKEVLWAL